MLKLNKIYSLRQEIASIEEEIYILSNYKVNTAEQEQRLEKKKLEVTAEIEVIENLLATINDSEKREVLRQRLILNRSWSTIGKNMNMDRTTAYKIFKKYEDMLENAED